jgi:CHASE2 domain-containing sensor protein
MSAGRPRRRILLLAVAIVAIGVAGLFKATGALHGLEERAVDARFELRGTQSPPSDVVVVGMDDKTLGTEPDGRLPLNR